MEYIDIYDKDLNNTGESVPRFSFLKEGQYALYVLALLENRDGQFLITQRSMDKKWAAGWWEVTGGGVSSGETSTTGVIREVAEEVGLDVSGIIAEPIYQYENVDLEHGDNYIVNIYHFRLDFQPGDVKLQESEAVNFKLATWEEITRLNDEKTFLHYKRLEQALTAEGYLPR